MPTHDTHDYNRWKYDTHYDTPYDGYGYDDHYSPFDHYQPYDHYRNNDHYGDYGSSYGGYMHADDFTAQKHEKVQGKNI